MSFMIKSYECIADREKIYNDIDFTILLHNFLELIMLFVLY